MLHSSDTLSKVVHNFARFMWGDRNLRYWRVLDRTHDAPADMLTDLDQISFRRVRGRNKIMNNKDPESVFMFKRKYICL